MGETWAVHCFIPVDTHHLKMYTVSRTTSAKSEIVMVTKKPQESISAVSLTVGDWVWMFYDSVFSW